MATNEQDKNLNEMSPSEYFDILKGRRKEVTDEDLSEFYDNALALLNKYKITGQIEGMKKLIFLIETIDTEREIVKLGINTIVYREDVEEYIDDIASNAVKIIELERYDREIPDEIVDVIAKTKHLFTKFYVVFTDYTGKVERKTQRERRAKDPILFGTIQNLDTKTMLERFYFLGDWEDEYCDLTLERMVEEFKCAKSVDIRRTISTPKDIEELKQQLTDLTPKGTSYKMEEDAKKAQKKHFFKNINPFKRG